MGEENKYENKQINLDNIQFEDGIRKMEKIITRLESADTSLDESFELYQQGVALSKACSSYLEDLEKKIQIVSSANDDEEQEIDFLPES